MRIDTWAVFRSQKQGQLIRALTRNIFFLPRSFKIVVALILSKILDYFITSNFYYSDFYT